MEIGFEVAVVVEVGESVVGSGVGESVVRCGVGDMLDVG